jgi:hypothetical protein
MTARRSPFLTSKQTIVLISAVVLLLAALAAYLFFRKSKPDNYNQQYVKYIESYTSGTISKKSTIKLHLAGQVSTISDIGKADDRNLFEFSPSIEGKTYWLDAQTVEFRPDEPLKSGETYEASFALNSVTETEKDLAEL